MGRRLTLLALTAAAALVTGDKPQPSTWNLKFSDPGRGAKFLNVPIQYGEWVPIDKARAIVEDVATRLSHQDTLIAPAPAEARIDTQEPTFVHVLRPPKNLGALRSQKAPPKNPHHNNRRPHPPQHHRRKDHLPVRFQQQRPGQKLPNNNRRNKKLPLPYPKNKLQKNYIRGQQGRRPPLFKTNSKVFKTKPQPFNPNTKPSNGFLPSINPFKFFEQSPPKRPAVAIPQPKPKIPFFRPEPTYLESLNAIQTIPAPDLSKVGPPIITVDDSAEGDIIFGNSFTSNNDPLAGFVSLDFDGFTVGEREEKSVAKPKQQKTTKDPKQKLSVAIATKASSAKDLVVALNNNQKDGEAFIITGKVPNGFTKVDIPFMDPSKHRGELPRVFIAPIGGPIPEGYKGKPLLSEPLVHKPRSEVTNDKFIPTTTETILLVQESKTDDEIPAVDKDEKLSVNLFGLNPLLRRKPGSAAKLDTKPSTTATPKLIQLNNSFKLKLQRQRPSLSQFYLKNKKKAEKLAEIAAKPLPTAELSTTTHFSSSDPKPAPTTTAGRIPTTTKKPTELKTTVAQEPTISEYVDTSTTTKLVPISSTTLAEPVQVSLHEEEQTTQFVPTIIPRQASITTTSTTTTKKVTTTTTVVVSTSSISTTTTTAATTTTTNQPDSTTAKTTAEESTKRIRTTQDPFLKLESIVAQKQNELKSVGPPPYQGDLITGETLDENDDAYNADTPKFDFPKPFRNRPRFRKYNSFSNQPGDKPGNFGKRIRSRKRPAFWNNARFGLGGFGIEPTVRPGLFKIKKRKPTSTEATSTTIDNVNTEEFKRKLKPYFENLYGALTREEEEEEENNSKRYGLPRRRSSTPTPPITINAEIYEVNPRSRERITTARPKKRVTEPPQTTTTRPVSESSTTLEDDYQPTTTTVVNDVTTTQQQPGLSASESHDKNPPLEYQEYVPTPHVPEEYDPFGSRKETTTDQVHETADKHSITTATQAVEETEIPTEAPLTAQYVADETSTHNEQTTSVEKKEVLQGVGLDLNIENSINLVDQIYEESQQIETTWEEVRLGSSSQRPEESTTNGRLTSYEKDIDPQEHKQEEVYVTDRNTEVINEHGKQAHAHTDETFVEPNLDTYAGWKGSVQPLKPYVEIDRSVANNPIVRIEEIPITNPTDYGEPDIIYDTSKDGFDDDSARLTFNYPVKFELIVPETTTIKEAPVTTTKVEDVTFTTEKATKSPTIVEAITTTEVEVEVPVTTDYHIPTTTTAAPSPTIVTTTDGVEESATARIYPSPHKVPTDLWSAYQHSHETTQTPTTTKNEQETDLGSGDYHSTGDYPEIEPLPEETPSETTTEGTDNDHESEESQTEGLSVASIMSYLMPANATGNSSNHPQHVEDKTVKSEAVAAEETTTAEPLEKKVPKAFDFNLPAAQNVESGQIKIHSFGVEQIIPLRKPQIDHPFKKRTEKDGYVKKREEWIKNWVARKYNKGPKRPRLGPLTSTTIQEESDNPTTLQPEQEDKDTLIFFSPTIRPKQISLEPTVQPKTSRFNVDFDVTVRDGTVQKPKAPSVNELKSSLLEKYSSARQKVKNSLFHKVDKHQPPKKGVGLAQGASSGVPRGANIDLFRNYGGDKLSQAEFERQVLGVSTATEISVKSMICIKGRCFNADDMGKLLYK